MTERDFADRLQFLLNADCELHEAFEGADFHSACSYREVGVLTSNEGIVVRMLDGSEFQITVVRSR